MACSVMGKSVVIGKFRGIDIKLHYTWFILFVSLIILTPFEYQEIIPFWQLILLGIMTGILTFVSVGLHEFVRSYTAISKGAYLTAITLYIFGGIPYYTTEPKHWLSKIIVSITGLGAAFILAGIFFIIQINISTELSPVIKEIIGLVALFNLAIGLLNFIPALPLDGGRILKELALKYRKYNITSQRLAWAGRITAIIIMVGAVSGLILNRDWILQIPLLIVALSLEQSSSRLYQRFKLYEVFHKVQAKHVMNMNFGEISSDISIHSLINKILTHSLSYYFVVQKSEIVGFIYFDEVHLSKYRQRNITPRDIMIPLNSLKVIPLDQSLSEIMEIMEYYKFNHMPVVEDERIVGIVERDRVKKLVRLVNQSGEANVANRINS